MKTWSENKPLRKSAGRIWKWSWLVTLPVAIIFILWLVNTAFMFHDFKLRLVTTMHVSLRDMGNLQAGFLLNELKSVLFPRSDRKEDGLRKVHLFIREADIKRLNSHLPYSGREYVKGKLLYPDGNLHEVNVRYRGDFSYHWSGRKKSLRVKTKKSKLFEDMRLFNLIIPKTPGIMNNYLSYLLARRLGLLAPEPELVEVFVNGEYKGVELKVEQPREQFLRRMGRMPGDLYSGEIVGRDAFEGVFMEVFLNAGYWTKDATNNHNPPEWNEALKELTVAIYRDDMDRVMELIDLDSWAGLAAFMTLSQTSHIDATHNWRLFFDPGTGRFYPVVWDPVGWDDDYMKWLAEQTNSFDIITTVAFDRLHRDQRFLLAKHEKIEEFFRIGGQEYILGVLADTKRLEASLKSDFNLHFDGTYMLTPGEVLKELEKFKDSVSNSLETVRRAYLETPPVADYSIDEATGSIRVNVRGFAPVRFMEIDLDARARVDNALISWHDGKEWVEKDVTRFASVSGDTVRIDVPLFSARRMVPAKGSTPVIIRDAEVVPASYELLLKGVDTEKILMIRAGYADEEVATLPRVVRERSYDLMGTFNPVPVAKEAGRVTWEGDRLVDGVMSITGDLIIRPGTTVRLTPGSSLVIRGKLFAEGTKSRPISFVPAKEGQAPWGSVVLHGQGSNGSVLRSCEMRGGSGLRHKFVEYSAMLSIHDVKGVEIEDCSFSDNAAVDDMVHAVYSEVSFRRCRFSGALSDALDLDYVTGVIDDSVFTGSGNDALDLMSSSVAVTGSRMTGSGDKGMSVGEGTEVLVWNTTLVENSIGLQAKDHSKAVLYNVDITDNTRALDAYKKNWQYGDGGHVFVFKSTITGSSSTVTADKDSTLMVYDTFLAGETEKNRGVHIDGTVDSDPAYKHKAGSDDDYLEIIREMGFTGGHLQLVDPERRGALGHEA